MQRVRKQKKSVAYIENTDFVAKLNPTNPWNVLRRTFKFGLIDQIISSRKDISLIKQDISTFEEIYLKLTDDLTNLQALQQRIEYSKTFKGKYYHVLGHFFSLYCVWKIFISFINIVFLRVGKGKLLI